MRIFNINLIFPLNIKRQSQLRSNLQHLTSTLIGPLSFQRCSIGWEANHFNVIGCWLLGRPRFLLLLRINKTPWTPVPYGSRLQATYRLTRGALWGEWGNQVSSLRVVRYPSGCFLPSLLDPLYLWSTPHFEYYSLWCREMTWSRNKIIKHTCTS